MNVPTVESLKAGLEILKARKGLGDVVAAATTAAGIQPCDGCEDRREWLNEKFPLGTKDGNKPR